MKKVLVETESCKKYSGECFRTKEDIGITHHFTDYLIRLGVTHVVGWYKEGHYEGSGDALIRFNDGTFALKDLCHCSCYDPWEEVEDLKRLSFEETKAKVLLNPEYWDDIKPIFDTMEKFL